MRRNVLTRAAVAGVAVLLSAYANAQEFQAALNGFEEVGPLPKVTLPPAPATEPETFSFPTGAILSKATGTLELDLNKTAATITYKLTYSAGLSSNVTQAHIHFGKRHVPGGIMVFFCSNLPNPPTGTPTCPTVSGTVTGTWTPGSIQAIAGQNVTAGDFGALVAALTSDTAYANIHTVNFPSGEIRGQVHRPGNGRRDQ
jgi:CHRD domain